MRPLSCSSRRLMQRIMVDLPEPEGPQTTTRSLSVDRQVNVLQRLEVPEELAHLLQHDDRLLSVVQSLMSGPLFHVAAHVPLEQAEARFG